MALLFPQLDRKRQLLQFVWEPVASRAASLRGGHYFVFANSARNIEFMARMRAI
jgi:hypothetical protein